MKNIDEIHRKSLDRLRDHLSAGTADQKINLIKRDPAVLHADVGYLIGTQGEEDILKKLKGLNLLGLEELITQAEVGAYDTEDQVFLKKIGRMFPESDHEDQVFLKKIRIMFPQSDSDEEDASSDDEDILFHQGKRKEAPWESTREPVSSASLHRSATVSEQLTGSKDGSPGGGSTGPQVDDTSNPPSPKSK